LSIREVRWSSGDDEGADELVFFRKLYKTYQRDLAFFLNQRVVTTVKEVELVSVIMLHIVLGG